MTLTQQQQKHCLLERIIEVQENPHSLTKTLFLKNEFKLKQNQPLFKKKGFRAQKILKYHAGVQKYHFGTFQRRLEWPSQES